MGTTATKVEVGPNSSACYCQLCTLDLWILAEAVCDAIGTTLSEIFTTFLQLTVHLLNTLAPWHGTPSRMILWFKLKERGSIGHSLSF